MSAALNSTLTPGITWKKVILWLQFSNKKHTLVQSIPFYVGVFVVPSWSFEKNSNSQELFQ